ncbi:glycosyltransferase family 2 protein [Pseudomonas sp. NPDC078700]|uniref:glycosyltransferase family 2 protein n=1 Tax=Pseudomonas sp. NPDC078700 TaxID=3364424 RepID=UPI0037C57B3A
MQWPLVSVLVPCYNHEKYIEESLLSILQHDYDNIELIVVNDGSTDGSADVINGLRQRYDFQFYSQSNQGVSAALNNALAHARGEFIVTHDSDDIMLPGKLRYQVGYLLDNPDVGCVGARAIMVNSKGEQCKAPKVKTQKIKRFDFSELLELAFAVGGPVAVYRREAIDRAGGYDPAIKIQDFQITLKIAHLGYRVDMLPGFVMLYRRHDTNISKTAYKSQLDYDMAVIDAYQDHAGYASAKVSVINKALKEAVVDDPAFAWKLFKGLPIHKWNLVTWKRFRRFLTKRFF